MRVTYRVNLSLLLCTYFYTVHGRHITRQQSLRQQISNRRVDPVPRNRVPEWNPSAWFQSYERNPIPVISRRPDDVNRFQNSRARINIGRRVGPRRRIQLHNSFRTATRNIQSPNDRTNNLRINLSLNRQFGQVGVPRTFNHNIRITTGNQRRNIQISHDLGGSRPLNGLRNGLFPGSRTLSKSIKPTNTIDTIKPDVLRPDSVRPDSLNLGNENSNSIQLDTLQPDSLQRNILQPDSQKPDTLKPNNAIPDISNMHTIELKTLNQDAINLATLTPDAENPKEKTLKVDNINLNSAAEISSVIKGQTASDNGKLLTVVSVVSTKPVEEKVSNPTFGTKSKSLNNDIKKQSSISDKIQSSKVFSSSVTDSPREVTTEEPDTPDSPDLPDLESR